MPLPLPNLDDRDFNQLVEDARRRVRQSCPDWTDLSPNDPGWALLELFAYLTETMIYRLNRLPEKAYIEFLRLMGVTLYPPAAARVTLQFSVNQPHTQAIEIPRGTRVTTNRLTGAAEAPIFTTARTVTLAAGQTQIEVPAYHCEWIQAELAGTGTGLPGLSVTAARPPLVAPTGDGLDLVVGVEALPSELGERVQAIRYQGKAFRIWREVETFANLGADRQVYRVDRLTGVITFAPSVQRSGPDHQLATAAPLAAAPAATREIRLWYRRGGGSEGNVAANTLTVLKDPIPGVQVTNPEAATGGRGAETLQNALIRGPLELHALERAVTASDFELLAQRNGAVNRAKAFTKASLWQYAAPGTVEVLLVPQLPNEEAIAPVTAAQLEAQQTTDAQTQIQQLLDERRPLGTTCLVNWVRYKTVTIHTKIVVYRGEDPGAVKERVLQRLHQTINPLVWPFGQPVRVDRVYEILLAESGVSYAEQVRFQVEDVPNQQVNALAVDGFQPQTWYAGAGDRLFRSLNNGEGWESVWQFPHEVVQVVQGNTDVPGLIVAVTHLEGDAQGSIVYFSFDCGETWQDGVRLGFLVYQVAWVLRAGNPILLMATGKGLYALTTRVGANPVQLQVDGADPDLGFYAVAVATDARGTVHVAVAAEEAKGIFLSQQEGKSGTFQSIGLAGEDVRVLAVQQDGPRTFLWAGVRVAGNEAGQGVFRWELSGSAEGWRQFQKGWTGGSVLAIAVQGSQLVASSYSSGVLLLDSSRNDAEWQVSKINCGLPTRSTERLFYPVDAVDLWENAEGELTIMAGGLKGVYRSRDNGTSYESVSQSDFSERVMLPPTWLFCSGKHHVEVISQ